MLVRKLIIYYCIEHYFKDVEPTTRLMPEFTLSCERLLGKWTLYVNMGSTVILLGGALIVYWIIIADLSRNVVNSIYGR